MRPLTLTFWIPSSAEWPCEYNYVLPSIHPSICKIGSIALAHYFLIFCIKFLMLSKKKVEPIFLGKFLCLKCSKRGSFEPKINIFQKLYRMAGMKKL